LCREKIFLYWPGLRHGIINKKMNTMDTNITLMLREARIAEGQLHSSHYLKTVTELGDGRKVLAVRDIFSTQGLKLVNKGSQFNSAIYQRLLNHKLSPKLDDSLTTEDCVTHEMLAEDAAALIGFEESLTRMRNALTNDAALLGVLSKIPLKSNIAFKLTVMRTQRKELFQRSLYVTLVSIYIGLQAALDERSLVNLATAALVHDIGLLHVEPRLLERSYRMTREERQHLFAHPITAWMILREDPDYAGEVAAAVLQHHEHLDGSGYPQGISSEEFSLLGQIITVAEVVASHFGKENPHLHAVRLETMLKLNARRYGRGLIGHLKVFYASEAPIASPLPHPDKQYIAKQLGRFAEIFQAWEELRSGFGASPTAEFINERMYALKIEALDAGLDFDMPQETLASLLDDPDSAAHLRVLIDETMFQIDAILRELRRRWPQAEELEPGGKISDWLDIAESHERQTA
jgi:HD-GYP domain-containing protein (c-di-GMP phosphodiesterase class II)